MSKGCTTDISIPIHDNTTAWRPSQGFPRVGSEAEMIFADGNGVVAAFHGMPSPTLRVVVVRPVFDLRLVQQVLGHKTFALTADTYTHLYNDALQKGVEQFPNLEVG